MKERFKDLADMLMHLTNGGKVGSDNWGDDQWIVLCGNSIVHQDGFRFNGIIDCTEHELKKRYKWKPQPRKVGIAEVYDLLVKGAWLRPIIKGYCFMDYYYMNNGRLYSQIGNRSCRVVNNIADPSFLLSHKEWYVVKEPQEYL